MNREELAWAAGFMDGEGSFLCRQNYGNTKKRYMTLRVQASQCEPQPLERLRDALGMGKVYGPYEGKSAKWNKYWSYHLDGIEKCQAAIAMLWTFLSEPKKAQVKKALSQLGGY